MRQTFNVLNYQRQAQCDRDIGRVAAGGGLIELRGNVAPGLAVVAILRQMFVDQRPHIGQRGELHHVGMTSGRGNDCDQLRRGRLLGMQPIIARSPKRQEPRQNWGSAEAQVRIGKLSL
jgi:hypothetical protein